MQTWAEAFPDPRREPEIGMEVILPAHMAARFAGLYSMRKAGYVLRSARVLGALGYSAEVIEPAQGLSWRGTSDDKLFTLIGSRALAAYGDVDGSSAANNHPWSRKCIVRLFRRSDTSASAYGCAGTHSAQLAGAGSVG